MKWKTKCLLVAVPAFLGILILYIIPFIKVLFYSVIDNQFNKNFVGLKNYFDALNNDYFRLALKNSVLIIIICVPIILASAFVLSVIQQNAGVILKILFSFFIIPIVIPSASIIDVWQRIFYGFDNVLPIYSVFIWKNIGICIILISASVNTIPNSFYEAATLDGAGTFQRHFFITFPCCFPSIIFSALITIVNSFKIYKESFLYFGTNYPPEHSYTLQYYMNNNFLKLDYQALSSGAVINTLLILIIVAVSLKIQRRFTQ